MSQAARETKKYRIDIPVLRQEKLCKPNRGLGVVASIVDKKLHLMKLELIQTGLGWHQRPVTKFSFSLVARITLSGSFFLGQIFLDIFVFSYHKICIL